MTVKAQKKVLIYGICYFLVFILLSAIAPIARDGLMRENTTAEEKKEPEQKTERPEQPADDKPTESEDTLSYRIDGGTAVITGVSDNCVSLIIPEKIDGYVVSAIEEGAFAGARGLVEAVLPDTVTYVGEKAFCDCIALTSVTLSNGLTEICYGTFLNCRALKSVYIPESVSMIGDCAFDGCVSLQEITLPKRLKSLGKEVFANCSHLGSLVLPDTLKDLPAGMCAWCSGLRELVLPKSVRSIDSNAVPDENTAPALIIYVPMPFDTFREKVTTPGTEYFWNEKQGRVVFDYTA